MFDIGMQELIVIFIVILLVFGPKRLPELARTIGKGLSELRRSIEDAKYQVDRELRETEIEETLKKAHTEIDINNLPVESNIKPEESSSGAKDS